VQDNLIRFMNVEKPGPKVLASTHVEHHSRQAHARLFNAACAHLPASLQELSVSLVDNALQQLKQLKQQA
jgi:hypothetical protein